MSDQQHPNGATWITPYLTVTDADKATDFYHKAFRFEKLHSSPGNDGTTWHAELKYKNQLIMIGKQGAYGCTTQAPASSKAECPIQLYIYTENVDELYEHAIKSGAKSLGAPENMFWGDRMCRLECPEGYIWCFATNVGEHQ